MICLQGEQKKGIVAVHVCVLALFECHQGVGGLKALCRETVRLSVLTWTSKLLIPTSAARGILMVLPSEI
jgi:hypothetical protein